MHSMSSIMFIFYLIMSLASFSEKQNLLSKQSQRHLSDNRYFKHVISLLIFVVLVVYISEKKRPTNELIIYSIIGYAWFILTTKQDIEFTICIFSLLVFGFLLEYQYEQLNKQLDDDKNVDNNTKNKIKTNRQKDINYIFYSTICLTIVGSGLYLCKKHNKFSNTYIQNGGSDNGFDVVKFLMY